MEQAVAPQLDEFVSEDAFERICQAWLRERVEEAVEAGRWWGPIRRREGGKLRSRAYEADAVAVGESGEVLALGSCKWSASAAHEHSAAELDKLELIREELGAPRRASTSSTGSVSRDDLESSPANETTSSWFWRATWAEEVGTSRTYWYTLAVLGRRGATAGSSSSSTSFRICSLPLWADLTRAQRQVLGAIADGQAELLSRTTLETMGLGKSTAQQARDTLSAEGHLRREPDNRVAIVDPFLARWLRR